MPEIPARLETALADRYRLERELGEGGMATVYLARDLKHERSVALKVLRPELAAVIGGERFLNEIKVTAKLQHPNILALYDSGEADTFLYYVMPLVEDDTLRDKLDREKQLSVDETVELAREVAAALHYAHEHGVVHRDIKPENILLQSGQALVADFGIALAVSQAGGTRLTETGMSLGTPHYMSPEQATGDRELDARSDVYSLGAMVYEMLVGEPPHLGNSVQAIIAKILTSEPELVTVQRPTIPPNVAAAVHKALAKHPADRFTTAAEFADALTNPAFTVATIATAAAAPEPGGRRVLPLAALAAVMTAIALWAVLRPAPPVPVIRYGLALPQSQAPYPGELAIPSPDGSRIVYIGPAEGVIPLTQLWVKAREDYAATPLAGTEAVAGFTFSPDGEWIAFVSGGQVKKIPIGGGPAVTMIDGDVFGSRSLAWLDDGTIVAVRTGFGRGFFHVSDQGGTPTLIPLDNLTANQLAPLPGGRGVLFVACTPPCADAELRVLDVASGTTVRVVASALYAQYLESNHLVYVQAGGTLMAVEFDLGSLQIRGTAVPVVSDISFPGNNPLIAISTSGTLVMRSGVAQTSLQYELVWVDQSGRMTAVDSSETFRLTGFAGNQGWALSPDGSRLAIGVQTEAGDDIWVKSLPRGALQRVTFDPGPEYRPRWAPDGRSVVFGAIRASGNGLYQRRADGTGTDSLLLGGTFDEGMWSPDGRWLLLRLGAASAAAGGRDIFGFRPDVDSVPVPVLATEYDDMAVALSPDGTRMAYQSDETGRTEVFVRPFPDVDSAKRQLSNGGATAPLWSRDGRELFYVSADNDMMAVSVSSTLEIGEPRILFRFPPELLLMQSPFYTPWDIASDGRFIMARSMTTATQTDAPLIVVENWFEELKALLGN
ncbi:MAG: protein kinase [Gemmatimonadetes bacterium]|nr:protein kinase [Gemmatimonadota bacterium]